MNITKLDDNRKRAILNASLKEFSSKGYEKASTNIIAKEAGISKGLMFHYVKNKQELFLFVYSYFAKILEKEYYAKINLHEKDIFNRLRQSYLLQIELLKQYPWIFEFDKISATINSTEINEIVQHHQDRLSACNQIFNDIDESKFPNTLDIEKCKQFILWANIGFTNQLLFDQIFTVPAPDCELIILKLNEYIDELRKIFYQESEVTTK